MCVETQSEVSRLREENQLLEEQITKVRVENDQLRRKRVSSVSGNSSAVLEAASLRQSTSTDLSALREVSAMLSCVVTFVIALNRRTLRAYSEMISNPEAPCLS